MSLSLYSKPYKETNGVQENTSQGEMINRYKYHEELEKEDRERISREFTDKVFTLIRSELRGEYPNPTKRPPFDVCLGLPENRNTGRSLPRDICYLLSQDYSWVRNGFDAVTKTRVGEVMKAIPHDQRPNKVRGLYKIDRAKLPKPNHGFLIIVDVFETGSTVGGLCQALELEFPNLPRFVIALTHLHVTERLAK